jgi:phosphoribosylformylglycinamidine synthase
MRAIQAYYREQQREPTDVELETLAQTWSEHCVHKTLKSAVDVEVRDASGKPTGRTRHYDNLIKETIFDSTMALMGKGPNGMAPSGGTGVSPVLGAGGGGRLGGPSRFGRPNRSMGGTLHATSRPDFCLSCSRTTPASSRSTTRTPVCFKGRDAQPPQRDRAVRRQRDRGIGGVIRGHPRHRPGPPARCANSDVFCVAYPDRGRGPVGRGSVGTKVGSGNGTTTSDPRTLLPQTHPCPKGVIHPKRVLQQVVAGVRDYGNRMGIPTVNGAVYFDDRYLGNPLVFCGCVGIIPRTRSRRPPGRATRSSSWAGGPAATASTGRRSAAPS